MATVQRVGDLEISEDKQFQQREWKMERIGWVLMMLLVIAGLLGLLGGPGLFSDATVAAPNLQVNYSRFVHLLEDTSLRLSASPVEGEDTIRISISNTLLEDMRIEGIVPEPESVEAASDHLTFSFQLQAPNEEAVVTFYLNPTQPGTKQGWLGIDGGRSVELSLFVYP